MSNPAVGRFVWYDLMTKDAAAARSFYTSVIGWGTAPFEGAEGDYQLFTTADVPLGGVMSLPPEAQAGGAVSHWIGYVAVDDIAATAAKLTELGGTVMMGPMTIPNVGQTLVFADPQGAIAAAFEPERPMDAPPEKAPVGEFSWHELATSDWQAASAFYCALFGWEEESQMDIGEGGIYWMYKRPEMTHHMGGIFNKPAEMPRASWLYYVTVADLDAALAKVTAGGGAVVNGPMEVPGGERIAQCIDPQGAAFALHSR